MDVLIVGSLAYDSLETPKGSREDELGGSPLMGDSQPHSTIGKMVEMELH